MHIHSTRDFYVNYKSPGDGMLDEVTLSHLFRNMNSFTRNGLDYPTLLALFFEKHLMLPEDVSILEIGPGIGSIAAGMKYFMDKTGRRYKYKALDISEKMLKNISDMGFETVLADCLDMPLAEEKFDLVIANEVLSDLPTLVDFSMSEEDNETVLDAREMISKYNLDVPEYNFNFNYGAVKLVENLKDILQKGGVAFISEQSCGDGRPKKVSVVGHEEYTIDFGHLEKAAMQNGFLTKRGSINEILGADEEKLFVSGLLRPDIKELYNIEKSDKKIHELMAGIFTPDEFTSKIVETGLLNIFNIEKYGQFVRNSAEPVGKLLNQFEYLLLKK